MTSKLDSYAPPSYEQSLLSTTQPATLSSPKNALRAHLSSLASHISQSQRIQHSQLRANDQETLTTYFLPAFTAFLSHYSASGLPRAKLTFVPAAKVGTNPSAADTDLHPDDEFQAVERVDVESFWEDRDVAKRLANGLVELAGETPGVRFEVGVHDVAFRTVSPFGLFGTESGCGIVVHIKVDLS